MLNKKIELIYYEEKLIPIRFGYSIGTVYTDDPEDYYGFKLYNAGYCPSTKEFYYNRSIHLPKRVVEHFENKRIRSEILEEEMQELGIYNKNDVDKLFNDYNDARLQTEMIKEKTLNLKRRLKKNNEHIS